MEMSTNYERVAISVRAEVRFGTKVPLKENRAGREWTKSVEMDRNADYDSHEETRWYFVSAAEQPMWEMSAKSL